MLEFWFEKYHPKVDGPCSLEFVSEEISHWYESAASPSVLWNCVMWAEHGQFQTKESSLPNSTLSVNLWMWDGQISFHCNILFKDVSWRIFFLKFFLMSIRMGYVEDSESSSLVLKINTDDSYVNFSHSFFLSIPRSSGQKWRTIWTHPSWLLVWWQA